MKGATSAQKALQGSETKTRELLEEQKRIQSPLGFATLDKAAALGLATATPLTDLRQYINSDLGFSNLKICFFCSK